MIFLREITEENFDTIINMKRPDGEHYVASNCYSLAQAWLYRNDNDVFPYAIYCDETPVGFLLLEGNLEERKLYIWRIMFPEEHTGKGYGTEALQLILDGAKQFADKYDVVSLDCDPTNERAKHVYRKLGFLETGVVSHGSEEMAFSLLGGWRDRQA